MKVSALPALILYGVSLAVSDSQAQQSAPDPLIQPLADIQQAVRSFIEASYDSSDQLAVSVKPLDKRLRLANCAEPLSAQWAAGSRQLGRVTVKVHCAAPKPWRIHVQSTVTMHGMVWALARGVQRGDVMTRDLLVRRSVTLGVANPALSAVAMPVIDVEPWIGFAFSKRVAAGKVLDERMLKPAIMVSKGKAVLIRHHSAGLSLQTNGIALGNATAQQRVKVRNQSSGKVIDAIAVSRDIVEILH